MFKRQTPIDFVPTGYQADLDRIVAKPNNGCGKFLLWSFVGIVFICGALFGVISLISGNRSTPNTAVQLTQPPQSNGAAAEITNTVVPESTMDYCWFLTPTPVMKPTIFVTPDQWNLVGTAMALATGTPTPTKMPTQEPPKAWCNDYTPIAPTSEIQPTQLQINGVNIPPTSTLNPVMPIVTQAPIIQRQPITNNPQPTLAPQIPVVTQPPVIIYQTVVVMPTNAPTQKPSATPTSTATNTLTNTPTNTPTETPTNTATDTPTPTQTPSFSVLNADCVLGYPIFSLVNLGQAPSDWVQWTISQNSAVLYSGIWQPNEMAQGYPMVASGYGLINVGQYDLTVYLYWDAIIPTLTSSVYCALPTDTPNDTPTDTATDTPTDTSTPTETPTP